MTALPEKKLGRPKDPDREARRRAEILDAAAGLFARHGYPNTDVQFVADAVGVGKGTVYRYFPTKKELFLAAVNRGLDQLSEAIDSELAAEADPVEGFRRVILAYLTFFDRRPEMAELFIQERAEFREHHKPLYFVDQDDKCREKEAFFRRMVESGQFRDLSMETITEVVGDLLYGTVMTNYMAGRRVPPEAQARDVADILFRGILSDAGRGKKS